MESLVNDLTSLTHANASLIFNKTTDHRKLFGLKRTARKNLRLCHSVKRKKLNLRRSLNSKFHRSESSLAKTNASSHLFIKSVNTNGAATSISTHKHRHHHHRHHRHKHRHKSNHHHRHNSSIRSSSLNKHKHIMTLLIAARASIEAKSKKSMRHAMDRGNISSASSSTTCLSNGSSDNFKNLIRFKPTLKDRRKIGNNYLESTETLCSSRQQAASNVIGMVKKKTLNMYKVQKSYRYRNYRLHCVRLRRLEKKSRKKQSILRTRLQNNFTNVLNKTHGNRMTSVSTETSTSSSSSSSSTETFDLEESSCNTGCLCSSEEFASDFKRSKNANKLSENRSTSSSTSDASGNETNSSSSSTSASGRSRSSSRSSHLSISTSKLE